MKKTKIIAIAIIGISALTAPPKAQQRTAENAYAQTQAEAMPTVDQLIDKYVQALGGKAAIQKVNSRISKGTVEVVGMNAGGTAELYEKAPDKQMHVLVVPELINSYGGYNGKVGWGFDEEKGKASELKDKELETLRLDSEFYKPIKIKEQFAKITLKGAEKIQFRDGPRDTFVIEAKPANGSSRKMYFDKQTGLLIRQDTQESSDEAGKMAVREFYLDYKSVDGVMVPFTIRHSQGGTIIIIRLNDVKQNVAIDDSKFDLPARS